MHMDKTALDTRMALNMIIRICRLTYSVPSLSHPTTHLQHQIDQMATTQRDHQEGRLLLAIQAFEQTLNPKVRAIACSYDVSYISLYNRLHNRTIRELRHPNCRLLLTEELTLI